MAQTNLYEDIAKRTNGALYIGVIGPVRSGKSTFIKRFMETMVLPTIDDEDLKARAVDELPQSAGGKTIMTTEPKFIPEQPVSISFGTATDMKVRLIDCVGYVVPSAMGYIENNAPRMIKTPWYEEEIPFNMAAEIGTRKVIDEHSTLGIVVTTDGSITDIPRAEYEEAERRVIHELQELGKPFAVLLNSVSPEKEETKVLCRQMEQQYRVPVCAVNCAQIGERDIACIIERLLEEFPVQQIDIRMPNWITGLPTAHPIRSCLMQSVRKSAQKIGKMTTLEAFKESLKECDYIEDSHLESFCPGDGSAVVSLMLPGSLYYSVISEITGLDVTNDAALLDLMMELTACKREYDKVRRALEDVEETGYGIVMPNVEEMELEEPEIIRQSGRYGIRLRAQAPSIHMMKAMIETEVSPIVGSERQSEELVAYLLREFEENPSKIWDSNIFGTSLYGLVNEGLHNKLCHMPTDARMKMKETVERVINEGCNGLICIIV